MSQTAPLAAGNTPVAPPNRQAATPVTFEKVFEDEAEQITRSRRARGVSTLRSSKDSLIGLAFSGGGIRSATFNLGILQALAENRLLHKFDYLSTVSGGGYIGSWLAALGRRFLKSAPNSSFQNVEEALVPGKREPSGREEPTFLNWLRLYSNYLTPHTGLLSGDTWAMVGTWLRNVFLNQTVLGLFFVGIFVFCDGVLLGLLRTSHRHALLLLILGAAAWFIAAVFMARNASEQIRSRQLLLTGFQRVKVTVTVIVPFLLSCLFLNFGLWRWKELADSPLWMWLAAGALFYFLVWVVASVSIRLWREKREKKSREDRVLSFPAFLSSSLIAGAVGAGLGRGYCTLLKGVPVGRYSAYWTVAVLGTGAVMVIMLLSGALHLGLAGRGCRDLVREWWARLGGYLMLLTMGWMFLAGACAFGPLLVRWVLFKLHWGSIVPAVLWIAHNYLGVKAAKSSKTSGKGRRAKRSDGGDGSSIFKLLRKPQTLEMVAIAAPYVFGIGLVLLIVTAIHIASGLFFDSTRAETLTFWHLGNGSVWCQLTALYWRTRWHEWAWTLLVAGVGLAGLSLLLSRRVDVNDFSLHHFYRNRLVRCYLGASNPNRQPAPFTGFDPGDDVALKDLAGDYPGPYPILNAALNITSGQELGYATRRAKSFVFTPLYCGYDKIFPGEGKERFEREGAYEPSYAETERGRTEKSFTRMAEKHGIALGTAMAISGAAASPNMGYFTSAATGLFMTLFDVRLGWWMGNSRFPRPWQSAGPKWGLSYLVSELVAQCDENKYYVYLSDGGHFENLAVYELIKRHCKVIVACDADCDGQYEFEDLLGLIEKARTDFGARIVIDFSAIRPKSGRESERNFVVGQIYYDPKNPSDQGKLIYIKASLPPKQATSAENKNSLPDDVWRYSEQHKTFPHQTTADQWFDELQFESYRALGQCIGHAAATRISPEIDTVLG